MFGGLWPDIPVDEVPIGAITNGVHAHTWVSDPHRRDRSAAPSAACGTAPTPRPGRASSRCPPPRSGPPAASAAPSSSSSSAHRLGDALLDPDALTIGFARRFATYKRATLLLSQPDRLREMLLSADRPVQFVFAGKAHPADQPGKDMIREIELFARHLDVRPPVRVHPRLRHGRRPR